MNRIAPRIPKGMRDFLPGDMLKRQYVFAAITHVFERFGYEPLQTPALEFTETLLGKYGDEEKLIYFASHPGTDEKLAMRYDLTVPLARFVGMYGGSLTLPFRRYQIAPVWRAERPGRGRLREFFQCDIDCVGAANIAADIEIIHIMSVTLAALGFHDFAIKINNRKLLIGVGIYAGLSGATLDNLYRSIDKLDKIGPEGVREEMRRAEIADETIQRIMSLLIEARPAGITGYAGGRERFAAMRAALGDIPAALEGLEELEALADGLEALGVDSQHIDFDFAMVRGLGYYTGPIFEAVLLSDDPEDRVGSVGGGGRYDDLIGMFSKSSYPTVGMSLGMERLIAIMDRRGMYPPHVEATLVQVLVTVFSPETQIESMRLAQELRAGDIRTELILQDQKIGKQLNYADKKGIPLVVLIGPDEISNGQVKIKRLADQTEQTVPRQQVVAAIHKLL